MKKFRKGDQVEVICGKDKGRRGNITNVIGDRALVEGINVTKKHTKPNPMQNVPGGVINKVKSIHISNIMVVCTESNKPERVKIRLIDDTAKAEKSEKRQRYFKSNNTAVV